MQKSTIFFVLLVLGCSYAAQEMELFRSIQNTKLGRTLISTIQIELKSGAPDAIQKIVNLLQGLRGDLIAEGIAAKKALEHETARVAGVKENLQSTIKALKLSIKTDKAIVVRSTHRQAVVRKDLAQNVKNLAQEQVDLAANKATQKSTTAKYKAEMIKIAGQLTGLADAKKIIAELKTSFMETSFVELKSSLKNMHQHPKFGGFVLALSQLLESKVADFNDQNFVLRILVIIDKISSELVVLQGHLTNIYRSTITQLREDMRRLQGEIAQSKADIAQNKAELAQLKGQIDEAIVRIQQNEKDVVIRVKQLAQLLKNWAEYQAKYREDKKQRENEIVVVDKVVIIFKSNKRFTWEIRENLAKL